MKDYTKDVPTNHLRFVVRDGGRILQQLFEVFAYSADHVPKGANTEWRDVPVVQEEKPSDAS